MAPSKMIKVLILIFSFSGFIFANENIQVDSKLKKLTSNKIIFDVIVQNNTEQTLFFYPNGVTGYSYIVDKILYIIPNYDEKYGTGFVSAHQPFWNKIECIEIKPKNKIRYRFKEEINYNLKDNLSNVSQIKFSLCVIDKNINEINNFNMYLDFVKNNLLSNIRYNLINNDTKFLRSRLSHQ
jgi:hypothetical protein